ncbi:unnamed protein product [Prunus armeniaca]
MGISVQGVLGRGAKLAPLARSRIGPLVARDEGGFIGSRKGDMGWLLVVSHRWHQSICPKTKEIEIEVTYR